jgi:putative two-component system response regulator
MTWLGFLLVMGYSVGLLYEKKESAKEEIRKTYQGIIEMLSLIIDSVDKQTQSHSYRVSVVAERIAIQMRCPQQEIENIKIAALLHDLGKLGLSAEVLNKIGKLSAEEREHVKAHVKIGANFIAPVGGRVLDLLPYILLHHEKYDGTGYQNVMGEGVPLGARIIAVADYYDALLSDRPYRHGLSPLTVRSEILQNSGKHFDPDVVGAFAAIFQTLGADVPLISENLLRKDH